VSVRALFYMNANSVLRICCDIDSSLLFSLDDALRCSSSKQDDHRWKAFLGVR